VLLEAAALALPVVAMEVGGVAEVADGGPASRLVADGDLDALAKAVDATLADLPRARTDGARWRTHVTDSFGIEVVTEAYLRLYMGRRRSDQGM
jgi:glycosyltransferase involved in cell wall biosynthesis